MGMGVDRTGDGVSVRVGTEVTNTFRNEKSFFWWKFVDQISIYIF